MNNCPFCLEFSQNKSLPVFKEICYPYDNRVLYDTGKSVIIPTIGCIIPNYLLIVPKKHVHSLSSLDADYISDVESVSNLLESKFENCTFFEHGSSNERSAGTSIKHVHLHFLPIDIDLKKYTPEFTYFEKSFKEIKKIKGEYLSIRYKRTSYFTQVTDALPSQYLRRIFAKTMGIEDLYNWRRYPFVENMKLTYDIWQIDKNK